VRFLAAIGVFVLAAIFLGTGLTQKIFFSGPEFEALSTTVKSTTPYIVINSDVLQRNPGLQTVSVGGTETGFIAYGRTADVVAWLDGSDYTTITFDTENQALGSEVVVSPPTESGATGAESTPSAALAIVNPAGSDLWVAERLGEKNVSLPMNAGEGMSVIIASDGVLAAPGKIRLSWPIPSTSPFATAFIITGGILLLVGLALYIWALLKMKSQQGPRRRGRITKLPKPPRAGKISRQNNPKILAPAKGRRSIERGSALIAIPLGLSLALGLASCSPYQSGQGEATPTPTVTEDAAQAGPPPAVTGPQLANILVKVSETVSAADEARDATLAATRLVGPALEIRSANYAMRGADANVAALPTIPSSPITFVMPQATDTWPRVVMAVMQDLNDASVPTTGVLLLQQTPRENYRVEYSVTLEPDASVPEVAPATVGSAIVAPDSKLLLLEPDQLAAAYGDILLKGEASPYWGLFDPEADSLRTQVGLEYKDAKRASVGAQASLEFTQQPGSGSPIGLATLESGAVVMVSLNEVETVRPTEAGAVVNAEGQTKILAGISSSSTGIESTYGLQLAFYVPPLGSTEKIRLLGFSQGLIAAKEL
jgi:hypothetical protein